MKRGTPSHPKTIALAEALKVPRCMAVGILEMLWQFTSEYCPNGGIGKFSDQEIARAVDWRKTPAALIQGLIQVRWIEEKQHHRLVVHDWPEHCEDSVHARLARAGEFFAGGQMPKLTKLNDKEKLAAAERYRTLAASLSGESSGKKPPALAPALALPPPEPPPSSGGENAPPSPDGVPDFMETGDPGPQDWKSSTVLWFRDNYPLNVYPFDMQLLMDQLKVRTDAVLLRKNLGLWKETDRWQRGIIPDAKNYARDQWRQSPREPPKVVEKTQARREQTIDAIKRNREFREKAEKEANHAQ